MRYLILLASMFGAFVSSEKHLTSVRNRKIMKPKVTQGRLIRHFKHDGSFVSPRLFSNLIEGCCEDPEAIPSVIPTIESTSNPTVSTSPSVVASSNPSLVPSLVPSSAPSSVPSLVPSLVPSSVPSLVPSLVPSSVPSLVPSPVPSSVPIIFPSLVPSSVPTLAPSEPKFVVKDIIDDDVIKFSMDPDIENTQSIVTSTSSQLKMFMISGSTYNQMSVIDISVGGLRCVFNGVDISCVVIDTSSIPFLQAMEFSPFFWTKGAASDPSSEWNIDAFAFNGIDKIVMGRKDGEKVQVYGVANTITLMEDIIGTTAFKSFGRCVDMEMAKDGAIVVGNPSDPNKLGVGFGCGYFYRKVGPSHELAAEACNGGVGSIIFESLSLTATPGYNSHKYAVATRWYKEDQTEVGFWVYHLDDGGVNWTMKNVHMITRKGDFLGTDFALKIFNTSAKQTEINMLSATNYGSKTGCSNPGYVMTYGGGKMETNGDTGPYGDQFALAGEVCDAKLGSEIFATADNDVGQVYGFTDSTGKLHLWYYKISL